MALKSLPQESVTTFNEQIIKGLLKSEAELIDANGKIRFDHIQIKSLKFKGVVISDDLSSPSLTAEYHPRASENNIKNYVKRVGDTVIKAFESGHDLLMIFHLIPNWGQQFISTKAILQSNDVKFRKNLKVVEFENILKRFEEYVFSTPQNINHFVKRLERVLELKNKIEKEYEQRSLFNPSKGTEYFYHFIRKQAHQEKSERMFRNRFTFIEFTTTKDRVKELHKIRKTDKLIVFFPTRFRDYDKLNNAQKNAKKVEENIEAWTFAREIKKNFENSSNLIFYMEKNMLIIMKSLKEPK